EVFSGMAVQIWPSGRLVRVDRIVTAAGDADLAGAGESGALTFGPPGGAPRGRVVAPGGAPPLLSGPPCAPRGGVGREPLGAARRYLVKAATATAQATAGAELQVIDLDSRAAKPSERITNNEIGTCVLTLDRLIPVDRYRANRATGGFIVLDPETYDTIGIGIVEAADAARPRAAMPAPWRQDVVKRLLARAGDSRLRSAAT